MRRIHGVNMDCGQVDGLRPAFMLSRWVIFRNTGVLGAHFFRIPAPSLLGNLKDTAHAQPMPRVSRPAEEWPATAAPKMDLDDAGRTPAAVSLNEGMITPDHDLLGRPRNPPRTEEAATENPPASADKWRKGTANQPFGSSSKRSLGKAHIPRGRHRAPAREAHGGAKRQLPPFSSSWPVQWRGRWAR